MKVDHLPLEGAAEIHCDPIVDHRGWFNRWYCQEELNSVTQNEQIVQINSSLTLKKGAIRGLHFQFSPKMEAKIVRCIQGSIFDVIVDLRCSSETKGKWHSIILDSKQQNLLYIPKGFAHGFQTLENDSQILYLHTEFHSPDAESGFRYDSPTLGIQWPLPVTELSSRDQELPLLNPEFGGIDV